MREVGCGVVIPPGRPDLLAGTIRELRESRTSSRRMGARGREYVVAEADRSVAIGRYRALLRELIETPAPDAAARSRSCHGSASAASSSRSAHSAPAVTAATSASTLTRGAIPSAQPPYQPSASNTMPTAGTSHERREPRPRERDRDEQQHQVVVPEDRRERERRREHEHERAGVARVRVAGRAGRMPGGREQRGAEDERERLRARASGSPRARPSANTEYVSSASSSVRSRRTRG